MIRNTVFYFALLAAISAPAVLLAQAPTVIFVDANTETTSLEFRSEPASYDRPTSDAFTEMEAVGQCSRTRPRAIDVTLSWDVTRTSVEAHRIDISMFRDGFSKGRYVTSGERPAGEKARVFDAAGPGGYYYWRLLTKTPEGWLVSGSGRFDTPICPVDEASE